MFDVARRALVLLLPALFPSWRFFAAVAPSPRLDVAVLPSPDADPVWREASPTVDRLGVLTRLARLAWSPARNEALYRVTCAERIIEADDPRAADELTRRIANDLVRDGAMDDGEAWFCVRIAVVRREGARLTRREMWRSEILPLARDGVGA